MMSDRKTLENELREIKDELQTFMGQIPLELKQNGNILITHILLNRLILLL